MDFLKDHEIVIEMLRLLEENNRQDQAKDFSHLIACVDSMEQQYAAVLSELQDVKQQLAEMPEQRRSMRDALTDMVQTLENRLGEMREQLQTIREKIISCAKDAVSGFKQMGVSALDTAVCALGIKNLLESVQDKICQSMENTSASIRRVETMGQELRSAGNHLKNAGRAAVGRETRQIDASQAYEYTQAIIKANSPNFPNQQETLSEYMAILAKFKSGETLGHENHIFKIEVDRSDERIQSLVDAARFFHDRVRSGLHPLGAGSSRRGTGYRRPRMG